MGNPMNTTPKCPWCGAEMVFKTYSVGDFYGCVKCGSRSPDFDINKNHLNYGVDMAYAAAMQKAEPVARVMTLDEFTQDENAVYVEDCYGNVEITIMRYIVPMRKPMYLAGSTFERDTCAYEIKTYGKKWRAWTAKPTDAQRAATAWEVANALDA